MLVIFTGLDKHSRLLHYLFIFSTLQNRNYYKTFPFRAPLGQARAFLATIRRAKLVCLTWQQFYPRVRGLLLVFPLGQAPSYLTCKYQVINVGRGKHSSLLLQQVGTNFIKLFGLQLTNVPNKLMFVPSRPFKPSLMFPSEAMSQSQRGDTRKVAEIAFCNLQL